MVGWAEMARSGSLSLWEFLRLESRDHVPDQSWLSKTRTRLPRVAFKLCAEIVERSFAHSLDRGGMRRTWRRGRENVHERCLHHVTDHNLSLLRSQLIGAGTPREAVAGGYGCIFVLKTPTGAVLVAQILLIVSEDG